MNQFFEARPIRSLFFLVGLMAALSLPAFSAAQAQDNLTIISIEDDPLLSNAKRLGINLGKPDQYGAAQILKNVILNPGFEASEFGMIIHLAEGATGTQIQQDNWRIEWNSPIVGQPEGFWDGAEYEIVTGAATGRTGTVAAHTYQDNLHTYTLADEGITPQKDDAVFLRMEQPGFEGDRFELNRADTEQIRPGSPGAQSLQLLPSSEDWQPSYAYFMDSYWRDGDPSGGQLFKVEGNWRLEFWAKGSAVGETIEIYWQRTGLEPFYSQTFPLTEEWQLLEAEFFVPANADTPNFSTTDAGNPLLTLGFRIPTDSQPVWIDDAALYRRDYDNPTIFNDKFVNALQELNPGIVRNWGNQLGSSLDNQLAPPFARKLTAYNPRHKFASQYHYSLHEFLELAQLLNAEPWYVIPPTFTLEELENLMAYLAAPVGSHPYADKRVELGQVAPWTALFPTIHLEYGNEMWGGNIGNDNFIGATARGGFGMGQIGGPRIGLMKNSPYYAPSQFNFILGGQYSLPYRQFEISANSLQHDTIALAPYFGQLDLYQTDEEIFQPLFARPQQDILTGEFAQSLQYMIDSGNQKPLAIYEINFHSTIGIAPLSTRNGFVTGLNGALALPLYMLTYQRELGIRDQAAFTALQYSFQMDGGEFVRLWGLMRDLEATGIRRPTWQGLALANRAVRGDMTRTIHRGANPTWLQPPINGIVEELEIPYLQSFAFRDGDQFAVVLFNLHLSEPLEAALEFGMEADQKAILHSIVSNSLHNNNESGQVINIQTQQLPDFGQGYRLRLAPHSMHVVEWGIAGNPPRFVAPTVTPLPAITPQPTFTPSPTLSPQPTFTPIVIEKTVEVTKPVEVVRTEPTVPPMFWALAGGGALVLMVGAWLAARMRYQQ